jgi:hypothetical protein
MHQFLFFAQDFQRVADRLPGEPEAQEDLQRCLREIDRLDEEEEDPYGDVEEEEPVPEGYVAPEVESQVEPEVEADQDEDDYGEVEAPPRPPDVPPPRPPSVETSAPPLPPPKTESPQRRVRRRQSFHWVCCLVVV